MDAILFDNWHVRTFRSGDPTKHSPLFSFAVFVVFIYVSPEKVSSNPDASLRCLLIIVLADDPVRLN